jgi:cytochrome b561
VKLALLICATLMPLSGWLMGAARGHTDIKALGFALPNPFVVPYPEISKLLWEVHETTANILILAIGLHVAGALYHHFIRKDSVLVRMFPFIPARNRDNILP